jgi:predicted kinase
LPASYKTGVAEEISKIKGYPILRSDLIRIEVHKGKDIFDPKVAGNMNNRMSVYDEMFRRAEMLVSKGGVILDATFITSELRERAAEVAAKNNLAFVIFETSCPQEIALERIKKRF